MTTEHADLVIRAEAIHTLVRGHGPQRALAVGADRVLALSPDPHGLDALIGPDTQVVDAPDSRPTHPHDKHAHAGSVDAEHLIGGVRR